MVCWIKAGHLVKVQCQWDGEVSSSHAGGLAWVEKGYRYFMADSSILRLKGTMSASVPQSLSILQRGMAGTSCDCMRGWFPERRAWASSAGLSVKVYIGEQTNPWVMSSLARFCVLILTVARTAWEGPSAAPLSNRSVGPSRREQTAYGNPHSSSRKH